MRSFGPDSPLEEMDSKHRYPAIFLAALRDSESPAPTAWEDDGLQRERIPRIGRQALRLRQPHLLAHDVRAQHHRDHLVLRMAAAHAFASPADWSRWLEAAGATGEGLLHGPILNHASMLIDAAIDGQGIVLARTMLAASDLIGGRLVRPFQAAIPLRNNYWIVCPRATRSLPKIVAFRDWLLEEVAADRQRLASVA